MKKQEAGAGGRRQERTVHFPFFICHFSSAIGTFKVKAPSVAHGKRLEVQTIQMTPITMKNEK
jgi:hypothetical protein